MGDVIHSDKLTDRAADVLADRFRAECQALEHDGILDERNVIAFARENPQSAIRTLLIDPPEADDGTFLNSLRIAWQRELAARRAD